MTEASGGMTRFRQAIQTHLLPMMGARFNEAPVSPARTGNRLVSQLPGGRILAVRQYRAATPLYLFRQQKFLKTEQQLAEAFVRSFNDANASTQVDGLWPTISRALPELALVSYFEQPVLASLLDIVNELASQTYEGGRISMALGIYDAEGTGVPIRDFSSEDFSRAFSNGLDTLLGVGRDGGVGRLEALALSLGTDDWAATLAPLRLAQICQWTLLGEQSFRRLAVVLNRLGEILIIQDAKLAFAKRRGRWHHFLHDQTIAGMPVPRDRGLREAIYQSCLDVSFARTGGCIAVAKHDQRSAVEVDGDVGFVDSRDLVEQDDYDGNLRPAFLKQFETSRFQELDRRIRMELMAMDGAIVLDHRGYILTAGAIVRVPGGSEGGGGRRAAAVALSNLGLAIKISEDGKISGFVDGKSDEVWEVG